MTILDSIANEAELILKL